MITRVPDRPKLVAAACVALAAIFAFVILASVRGSSTVATQGTIVPPTVAPPGTLGTAVPTIPPSTEAATTTTTVATTTPPPPPLAPAPTGPPTTRPTPVVPEPPPESDGAPEADPFRLRIDRIGVDAPIVTVGVEPGSNSMEVPALDDVGWYRFGSLPGDASGTAVLVGHVDGNGRPGVFTNLRNLVPGDLLTVTLPDGSARGFAVAGIEQFDKQALPTDLFARGGPPRLVLITCGGPFDPATGHYLDNVVVAAAAI